MRVILGYEAGRAVWSENTPSRVRLPGWAGAMIVSGPTPRGEPLSDHAAHTKARRAAKKRLEDLTKSDYQARAAKGWATRRSEQ